MLLTFVLAALLQATSVPSSSPSAPPSPMPSPSMLRREGSPVAVPVTWPAQALPPHRSRHAKILGFWGDPRSGEYLQVTRTRSEALDASTIAAEYRSAIVRRATYVKGGTVRLCRGIDGREDWFHDERGDGIAFVYAVTPYRAYIASYLYPGYPGPSAIGQASVESLCPPLDPVTPGRAPIEAPPAPWSAFAATTFDEMQPSPRTLWLWTRGRGATLQVLRLWKFHIPAASKPRAWGFSAIGSPDFTSRSDEQTEDVPLCNGRDGLLYVTNAKQLDIPVVVRSVGIASGDTYYLVSYQRPTAVAADPAAERALRSLCP